MTPLPLPALPAQLALAALNHVLGQQAWARDRLRAHTGRSVCLVVQLPWGAVQATAQITPEASLQPAQVAHPTVTLTLRPTLESAWAMLREGPHGLAGALKLEGDVLLAAAIGELAQHLRWDIEEDLSHWVGDAAAQQLADWTRAAVRQHHDWRQRVVSGARAWSVDEAQLLVDRQRLQPLRDQLRDLEQRLGRLEHGARHGL